MLFSGINLRNALVRERSRERQLLNEVHELLNREAEKDQSVLAALKSTPPESNIVTLEQWNPDQIFSIEQIRKICIRYRLRFLDTSFFKSEFPYEAIIKIKQLENISGNRITSFYIIAPEKAFELENINKDPLLFAPIGNDRFYLIHQWGTDIAWYKRILCWPLQTFKSFLITLWIACMLFAFLLPSSVLHTFSFSSEIYLRIWLMTHTFIGMLGLCLWAGLAFDKTFSSMNWNSKYYN
jgi:hypothetical protein